MVHVPPSFVLENFPDNNIWPVDGNERVIMISLVIGNGLTTSRAYLHVGCVKDVDSALVSYRHYVLGNLSSANHKSVHISLHNVTYNNKSVLTITCGHLKMVLKFKIRVWFIFLHLLVNKWCASLPVLINSLAHYLIYIMLLQLQYKNN